MEEEGGEGDERKKKHRSLYANQRPIDKKKHGQNNSGKSYRELARNAVR